MVLGIYGAGGFGKETYDMVSLYEADKWEEIVFIDDTIGTSEFRGTKLYSYEEFRSKYNRENAQISITQGEPSSKKLLYGKVKDDGFHLVTLIHPHAYICPDVEMEEGVIVFVGSTISSTVHLGKCSTVLSYGLVGHDTWIGDFCQVSAMALVNGHVHIGDETFIGGASSIRDEVIVGSNSIVALGACVMKDVPDNVLVMGNPARVIQKNEGGHVFDRK